MGAEFIGAAVAIKCSRDEAFDRLAKMTDDEIGKIIEMIDPDEDEITPREWAHDSLTMVYDAGEGKRRDGAMWEIEGVEHVVTGGMTWGDDPTDLFQAVVNVIELGVTA